VGVKEASDGCGSDSCHFIRSLRQKSNTIILIGGGGLERGCVFWKEHRGDFKDIS